VRTEVNFKDVDVTKEYWILWENVRGRHESVGYTFYDQTEERFIAVIDGCECGTALRIYSL